MTTGYVYDEYFLKHDLPGHPEHAGRLVAIMNYLKQQAILPRLIEIPGRLARREELARCHHIRYIQLVEEVSQNGGGMFDADTYANAFSYEAASRAAGSLVDLTKAVVRGELSNGFALVRPPGHHATPLRAMGFCIFGTVAVAARAARFELGLERVAIIDFDVHHGNGTQAILDEDPHILFISSHQYPFYPGSGALDEIGVGPAEGSKVNIPLAVGTADEGFAKLYGEVVFPILRRFQPELILVSAGFDAHWQDPLANIGWSLAGCYQLCADLIALAGELCQGRIVFTLEGGYNLPVLAAGVGNAFRALLADQDYDDPVGPSPYASPGVNGLVERLKRIHRL
jgi:acetoin utilization deacetylase AcuC-like enzyme